MSRLLLGIVLALVFGLGTAMGNLLVHPAHAQAVAAVAAGNPPTAVMAHAGQPPCACRHTNAGGKWQIISVPNPDAQDRTMLLLLDTETGNTFRYNSVYPRWERVGM